jgi:hypothetical protein
MDLVNIGYLAGNINVAEKRIIKELSFYRYVKGIANYSCKIEAFKAT